MFRVDIRKLTSYNINQIKDAILSSLKFINKDFQEKKTYLLKPNLLKPASPDKAITTHPVIIKAVIELIKDYKAQALIGDSPGLSTPEKVLKKLDLIDFLNQTNTKIADFSKKKLFKNSNNLIYKELMLPQVIEEVDEIINLPKLKTHQMMVITWAVKNLYGFIYGIEKIKYHFLADKDYDHFAKLLIDIYNFVNPGINIIDGIVGMDGNGPSSGNIKNFNILAVSDNALSLDYILCSTFNLDHKKIPHLSVALNKGLKEIQEQAISTSSEVSASYIKLSLPEAHDLNFSMPHLVSGIVKKYLIPYPSINSKICIKCGLCRDICPRGAIKSAGSYFIDRRDCIRCYCCQELCDKGAIKVSRGLFHVWK